jgi:hypothetical protein
MGIRSAGFAPRFSPVFGSSVAVPLTKAIALPFA